MTRRTMRPANPIPPVRSAWPCPRIKWQWLLGLVLLFAAGGCGFHAVGLHPLSIRTVGCEETWCMGLTDSLQPTLRWEAFPRLGDLKADKAGRLATVRNPAYELRIWRAEGYFPAELVYTRTGLTEPVHTVETVLASDTLYLWTIRARFELSGESRVTEWGHWENDGRAVYLHYPVVSRQHLPSGYPWFRTPPR